MLQEPKLVKYGKVIKKQNQLCLSEIPKSHISYCFISFGQVMSNEQFLTSAS